MTVNHLVPGSNPGAGAIKASRYLNLGSFIWKLFFCLKNPSAKCQLNVKNSTLIIFAKKIYNDKSLTKMNYY